MYAHAFLRNFTCKLPRKSSAAVLRSVLISGSIPGRQTNKQHTMATTNGVPLHEVVKKLSEHAPPTLAESWDNVGLLVEPSTPHIVHKLFLTNDLTEDVLDEAIEVSSDFILSYHPPIFRGIKRITQDKWKDRLVVKAIEKRIAIYSPHTAYDVVKGGVNDWLISCFDGHVTPINPSEQNADFGTGRICVLKEPLTLDSVCEKVKEHLGLSHLRVGYSKCNTDEQVRTIACCAGSGSSVLADVKADVYLTGEMSHHEVLDAVSNNTHVILCEHSNTERGFLKTLVPIYTKTFCNQLQVVVSQKDKDPLVVI